GMGLGDIRPLDAAGREAAEGVVKRMHRQADLPQVVRAFDSPRRFASRLNGWQKARHENANDGDHHQQFGKGERRATHGGSLGVRGAVSEGANRHTARTRYYDSGPRRVAKCSAGEFFEWGGFGRSRGPDCNIDKLLTIYYNSPVDLSLALCGREAFAAAR